MLGSICMGLGLVHVDCGRLDVEDLIARGYTCSLAEDRDTNMVNRPGIEIVCDDGVCSKCIKSGEGGKPWLMKHHDMDPEDYLKHGFVCGEQFRDDRDAEQVCDDGYCVGCKKPFWSGNRGDIDNFLEAGFKCFLVRDVPKYALAEGVEVVCDDGECFGCIEYTERNQQGRKQPQTVDEMLALGYSCLLTSESEGPSVLCEGGRCFQCSPPKDQKSHEEPDYYPVTLRWLDYAEDALDDGYKCGVYLQKPDQQNPHPKRETERQLCEGRICLQCWWNSQPQDNYLLTMLTERFVERAEKLVKMGMKCGVSWGKKVEDMPLNAEKLCESGICFVCQ